jgi:hypothetical protein
MKINLLQREISMPKIRPYQLYCLVDEEYWMDKYLVNQHREKGKQDDKGTGDGQENSEYPLKTQYLKKTASCTINPMDIPESNTTQPENLQSFHFPKREMHFLKTGNRLPQK